MTNRFQEAKDFILRTLNDQYDGTLKLKVEALDTLQELIEEHQKNLTYISTLEKILKETDKALDKACELIDTKYDCPFEEYEYQFKDKRDCYICDNKSNECWKEYLLNERKPYKILKESESKNEQRNNNKNT